MPPGSDAHAAGAVAVLGDDLLSIAVVDVAAGQRLADKLRQSGNWLDVVGGIESVAVHFDLAAIDLHTAQQQLAEQLRAPDRIGEATTDRVEIPVCYGGEYGPDLDKVSAGLGISSARLIELHASGEYSVDMLGFTPGFAYIGGLPAALDVPRLSEPRQQVAAGSVGIADRRSGIYAMAGPGGWPLIGRTPLVLFDASATEPFRLCAGTRIRFKPIEGGQFRAWERT